MATTEVTLIQCTNTKRDTAARARDMYDESAYYRKMRAWAEARGDDWFILSAKHGLLSPDAKIDPYDERGLTERQSETIADTLCRIGVRAVHVCAGREYTNELTPALERRGIDVVEHFAGLKIGERMAALDDAVSS